MCMYGGTGAIISPLMLLDRARCNLLSSVQMTCLVVYFRSDQCVPMCVHVYIYMYTCRTQVPHTRCALSFCRARVTSLLMFVKRGMAGERRDEENAE